LKNELLFCEHLLTITPYTIKEFVNRDLKF